MTSQLILALTIMLSMIISCVLENYSVKPKYSASLMSSIPLIILSILNLLEIRFSNILQLILNNKYWVSVAIILLAILPVIAGIIFDVPICICQYRKREHKSLREIMKLSIQDIIIISKDGDTNGTNKDKGRINLEKSHMKYFLSCNLSGALSAVLLLLMVSSINGIHEELNNVIVYDALELIINVTIGYLLVFVSKQQAPNASEYVNPNNYRMDRIHQICNVFYLFISQTISYIFAALVFIFSIRNAHSCDSILTHILFSMEIISLLLFLYLSGMTEYAERIDAQAEVFWKYTPYSLAVGYFILALLLFRFSWVHFLLTVITCIIVCTIRFVIKPDKGTWHVIFPFVIIIMFALVITLMIQ